jgi:hypothetical protein
LCLCRAANLSDILNPFPAGATAASAKVEYVKFRADRPLHSWDVGVAMINKQTKKEEKRRESEDRAGRARFGTSPSFFLSALG